MTNVIEFEDNIYEIYEMIFLIKFTRYLKKISTTLDNSVPSGAGIVELN